MFHFVSRPAKPKILTVGPFTKSVDPGPEDSHRGFSNPGSQPSVLLAQHRFGCQ